MKRAIILLFFVLLLSGNVLSQEIINPDPAFYNTWVRAQFYDDIMQGKSPREAKPMEPLMQLHFYPDKPVVLEGSLNEGMESPYKVISADRILVRTSFCSAEKEMKVYLTSVNTLEAVCNGQKLEFKNLGKKYNSPQGVKRFTNDNIITGTYVSDGDTEVTFTTDGKVTGLGKYTEYEIPLFVLEPPSGYDVIYLRYPYKNGTRTITYHWGKTGDTITLYNLDKTPVTDEDFNNGGFYEGAEIGGEYVRLVKVE